MLDLHQGPACLPVVFLIGGLAGHEAPALPRLALQGKSIMQKTSNLPFDEWTFVFGSERLIGALLDRLTHHLHSLEMNGESYRLRQSKQRRCRSHQGVPLNQQPD